LTLEALKVVLHGNSPFTIHLVSGREFHVPHTDYAALTPGDSSMVVTTKDTLFEVIRLSGIESITVEKGPVA
jgi:hypothetical protein